MKALTVLGAASLALQAASAAAGEGAPYDNVEIRAHVVEPEKLEPTEERVGQLKLPEGFRIEKFAEDLVNPRMLAIGDDGTVYVSRRSVGDLLMLKDTDGDGRSDVQETVASRPAMHGIGIDGSTMYLATVNDVYRTEIAADGTLGDLERIINDLPESGQHPNRTLGIGPDGKLYISAGSTCNACDESNPESATMLRAELDGKSRTIFASGLRNTIGFGWHPETGELWGFDHGIDWLGDEEQGEELNRIEKDKKYGWPYIFADGKENPQDEPPGGITMDDWKRTSEEPVQLYTAHAAPMQMAFVTGEQFPAEYRGDAFVAMRGSWNRKEPSGYEVVRVDFENGQPKSIEPFLTGFLVENGEGGWGQLGRLAGLAAAPDGSLYLSDDSGGVIYRITYEGEADPEAAEQPGDQSAATAAPDTVPAQETSTELAMQIVAAEAEVAVLDVSSPAFEDGGEIPLRFSADAEDISPELSWGKGPEGTRSYAVLMEDPDTDEPKPFVHWIAADIPADVTSLREGLPPLPKLEVPEDVIQGANSRGSIGYSGMRPPVGDPPHTYHFQVFALDTKLQLDPGADRADVLGAMQGHVLAKGELTGTFKRD